MKLIILKETVVVPKCDGSRESCEGCNSVASKTKVIKHLAKEKGLNVIDVSKETTLEEAADNYLNTFEFKGFNVMIQNAFTAGANWAKNQSNKDMINKYDIAKEIEDNININGYLHFSDMLYWLDINAEKWFESNKK